MGNKWNEILETVTDQTQGSMPCICIKSGAVNYSSSRDLQTHLHSKVSSGDIPGAFILIEHEHVYTLGRRGTLSDILLNDKQLSALGIEIHHIDRGGQVTYHGPGQRVVYFLINLIYPRYLYNDNYISRKPILNNFKVKLLENE